MEFTLNVDDSRLRAAVSTMHAKLGDWSGAWPELADAVRTLARAQFESQGMGAWAPLSRKYAARKAKQHPGKPIMRASDRLFNSLTGGSSDGVLRSSAVRLSVGTSLAYAAYHQSGSSDGTLPRRPIFDFVAGSSDVASFTQPLRILLRQMGESSGFEIAQNADADDAGVATAVGAAGVAASGAPLAEGM